MNIFLLDLNQKKSARYLCDKHCIKMVLESAQMLSTAHHVMSEYTEGLYKPAHINHPSSIWTRESEENYMWHYEYFCYMAEEYEERYGKEHLSYLLFKNRLKHPPEKIVTKEKTEFRLAMPDKYKQKDPVQAYRDYYIGEKLRLAHWSLPSQIPNWILLKVLGHTRSNSYAEQ